MTPIDAVVFDLGNVIVEIDFDRALASWANDARGEASALKARFTFDAHYERHERGEIDAAAYFDTLRQTLGIPLTDEQFLRGWNAIFVREVPGIAALLQAARERWPIYAFSNSNTAHKQEWSQRFQQVLAPFSQIFVSSDIGVRKPDVEAFRIVAEAIAVPPARMLFFDDTLENVRGAEAIGIHAVHVQSPRDIQAALQEAQR